MVYRNNIGNQHHIVKVFCYQTKSQCLGNLVMDLVYVHILASPLDLLVGWDINCDYSY